MGPPGPSLCGMREGLCELGPEKGKGDPSSKSSHVQEAGESGNKGPEAGKGLLCGRLGKEDRVAGARRTVAGRGQGQTVQDLWVVGKSGTCPVGNRQS